MLFVFTFKPCLFNTSTSLLFTNIYSKKLDVKSVDFNIRASITIRILRPYKTTLIVFERENS